MKTTCTRDEYERLSAEEQDALAAALLAFIRQQYSDQEFGYESFPMLRYDHMVLSTLFHQLKEQGQIESSGYMTFRLAGRPEGRGMPNAPLSRELLRAARAGQVEEVRRLLKEGADIESKGENESDSALMEAARAGQVDVVRLLLDQGANVNARRSYDLTALLIAADSGHLPVVRLLVARGANVHATMAVHGFSAIDMARGKGHSEVVEFLQRSTGPQPTLEGEATPIARAPEPTTSSPPKGPSAPSAAPPEPFPARAQLTVEALLGVESGRVRWRQAVAFTVGLVAARSLTGLSPAAMALGLAEAVCILLAIRLAPRPWVAIVSSALAFGVFAVVVGLGGRTGFLGVALFLAGLTWGLPRLKWPWMTIAGVSAATDLITGRGAAIGAGPLPALTAAAVFTVIVLLPRPLRAVPPRSSVDMAAPVAPPRQGTTAPTQGWTWSSDEHIGEAVALVMLLVGAGLTWLGVKGIQTLAEEWFRTGPGLRAWQVFLTGVALLLGTLALVLGAFVLRSPRGRRPAAKPAPETPAPPPLVGARAPEPAIAADRGSGDRARNLARWRASGEPERWVEQHHHSWNHDDWQGLLGELRQSSYWPMDLPAVGAVLEELKSSAAAQRPSARAPPSGPEGEALPEHDVVATLDAAAESAKRRVVEADPADRLRRVEEYVPVAFQAIKGHNAHEIDRAIRIVASPAAPLGLRAVFRPSPTTTSVVELFGKPLVPKLNAVLDRVRTLGETNLGSPEVVLAKQLLLAYGSTLRARPPAEALAVHEVALLVCEGAKALFRRQDVPSEEWDDYLTRRAPVSNDMLATGECGRVVLVFDGDAQARDALGRLVGPLAKLGHAAVFLDRDRIFDPAASSRGGPIMKADSVFTSTRTLASMHREGRRLTVRECLRTMTYKCYLAQMDVRGDDDPDYPRFLGMVFARGGNVVSFTRG